MKFENIFKSFINKHLDPEIKDIEQMARELRESYTGLNSHMNALQEYFEKSNVNDCACSIHTPCEHISETNRLAYILTGNMKEMMRIITHGDKLQIRAIELVNERVTMLRKLVEDMAEKVARMDDIIEKFENNTDEYN